MEVNTQMARADRDLGINLDSDPDPEVTVYDDRLAYVAVIGALVIFLVRVLKS